MLSEKHIIRSNRATTLLVTAIVLSVPAFLIHLDLAPFHSDEPTRAVVTLEMMRSGDFIAPTFTGEYYQNKPPLYNWILAFFFSIQGKASEWILRIPTILFLYGFAFSIFRFVRSFSSREKGLLGALLFLTCGRILFWDSMLGLIDVFYSWITFMSFTVAIKHIQKEQYWNLFLLTYLLTAIGFLLKGMPSLVFQAITLLTAFLITRKFKKLFHPAHFAGITIFLAVIGGYLLLYATRFEVSDYLATLWDQSSQRTAVRQGFLASIQHLFLFHPNMIYHFLPWSLLFIVLLIKKYREEILGHRCRFITGKEKPSGHYRMTLFLTMALFVTQLSVYWLSPATIPRYVLMLAPLSFIPPLVVWYSSSSRWARILPYLIIVLFCLRIVFNFTLLPTKAKNLSENQQKIDALRFTEQIHRAPLKIIGKSWIDHVTVLYLMKDRKDIIEREYHHYQPGVYYLVDQPKYDNFFRQGTIKHTIEDKSFTRHNNIPVYLITFNQELHIP